MVVDAGHAFTPSAAQPILVLRRQIELHAMRAEGMEVALAEPGPVDEFDPELEGALGALEELGLVQAQGLVEDPDRRNRRLADTDGADLIGFDQRDTTALRQRAGQGRRGHPAGRTTTDDDDVAQMAFRI